VFLSYNYKFPTFQIIFQYFKKVLWLNRKKKKGGVKEPISNVMLWAVCVQNFGQLEFQLYFYAR